MIVITVVVTIGILLGCQALYDKFISTRSTPSADTTAKPID